MKRLYLVLFLILLSLFCLSCPIFFHSDITEFDRLQGQRIINYPAWVLGEKGISSTNKIHAVSLWLDWDEDYKNKFSDLIDGYDLPTDFNGKFRIELLGQYTRLCFNNPEHKFCSFYNWLGDVGRTARSKFIEIPQENIDEEFRYDCYIKKSVYDDVVESNKAKVILTKSNNKFTFRYELKLGEKKIIDCNMIDIDVLNSSYKFIDFSVIDDFNFLSIFPSEYILNIACNDKYIPFNYNLFWFFSSDRDGLIEFSLFRDGCFYCYEGISFRELSEDRSKISFDLLDAEESDFADFFEIHVKSKDDVELTFYKLDEEEQPIVVQSYSKPELVWKRG